MRSLRWSENDTHKFVKIFLNHEILWNTRHPKYKLKEKRLDAFRTLIAEFKLSTGISLNEGDVKVKIKNLRSTYLLELDKIIHRSGPDYTYKPTIKWFADWHKCFKNSTKKRLEVEDSQVEEEEPQEDPSENVWVLECVDNTHKETNGDPFVSPPAEDYNFILKSEPEEVQQKRKSSSDAYKIKSKKIKCRNPSADQSDRTFRGSMDSGLETSIKEDEFDIYGKYIASQLRQINLQKALRLQLEIQSLVSEARISELTGNH